MKYTNEHAVTAGIFLLKDGGRLYGFAKPTGPPSTEFFTWECVSVAIFLHIIVFIGLT